MAAVAPPAIAAEIRSEPKMIKEYLAVALIVVTIVTYLIAKKAHASANYKKSYAAAIIGTAVATLLADKIYHHMA